MFSFLLGFAFGLALTCPIWFFTGLYRPALVVPTEFPTRWDVILRYAVIVPGVSFLAGFTSMFGWSTPSLLGWLAGMAAVPAAIFLERRWRRHQAGAAQRAHERELQQQAAIERAELERKQREAGMFVLDPDNLPVDADDTVRMLGTIKRALLEAGRAEVAILVDRLYSRYARAMAAINTKFDTRELTYERSRGLVTEVTRSAGDLLDGMVSLARGVAAVDIDFAQRRLNTLPANTDNAPEREALERRLTLVNVNNQQIKALTGQVESALTALDDTVLALSRIDVTRPQGAEAALDDLRDFAARAERYTRTH